MIIYIIKIQILYLKKLLLHKNNKWKTKLLIKLII